MCIPTLETDRLERICISIFKAAGCSDYEAERTTELLVLANLRGHDSHGVLRVPGYVRAIQQERTRLGVDIEIVKETPTTALINGNLGLGQVIATRAMEVTINKAKENGVSIVTVYNCQHIGRMADYAEMALEHDMIGFVLANVGQVIGSARGVAAYGGKDGVLSTNPLCFAIPTGTKEKPFILDMATSVAPWGKVMVKLARGEKTPDDWLIDAQGHPTTDPKNLMGPPRGALLPFGGSVAYKGSGLGMVVDILGGILSGAGFAGQGSNGVFMMAIDIAKFTPIEEFKERVDQLIQQVKSSSPIPGFVGIHGETEVLVAGDPERREEERRRREGIFVEDTTWNGIVETAKSVGVDVEKIK